MTLCVSWQDGRELFVEEDINPYAERVHRIQLAMQGLISLCHPGLCNMSMSRLDSVSRDWQSHVPSGPLRSRLQRVIVDSTAAVAQHLQRLLSAAPMHGVCVCECVHVRLCVCVRVVVAVRRTCAIISSL